MIKHLKSLGFTNRLALVIVAVLICGMCMSFYLAILSIVNSYTGSLLCWTCIWTPIGTALSVVLGKVVDKNKEENTGASDKCGEGIAYAIKKAEALGTTVTSV